MAEMGGCCGTEIKGAPCPDLTLCDRGQETLPLICKNGDETGISVLFLGKCLGNRYMGHFEDLWKGVCKPLSTGENRASAG